VQGSFLPGPGYQCSLCAYVRVGLLCLTQLATHLCPDLGEQVLHILTDEGVVHDGAPVHT
jgi:hypothetical protein